MERRERCDEGQGIGKDEKKGERERERDFYLNAIFII